jgi:hypothetical protein
MPDVGKMNVVITIKVDQMTTVKDQVLASLAVLKTAGKIHYAEWSIKSEFEPESGTV